MEDENRRHFRGIRILVTLALLAACLSFAFSYILFKDVSIPLNRLRSQEFSSLQSKVDSILATRLNGRMDVELQMAIMSMHELESSAPEEIKAQARKAIDETTLLLNMLREMKGKP